MLVALKGGLIGKDTALNLQDCSFLVQCIFLYTNVTKVKEAKIEVLF